MVSLAVLSFRMKLLLGSLLGQGFNVTRGIGCPTAKEFMAKFWCPFFEVSICLIALIISLLCFLQRYTKWVRDVTLRAVRRSRLLLTFLPSFL
jgi:hypothetical protein